MSDNVIDNTDIARMPKQIPLTVVSTESTRFPKKIKGMLDIMDPVESSMYDTRWRDDAACKALIASGELETNDFFYVSINRKNISKVLQMQEMCNSCPVAAFCLHEALMFGYDGIWAGTTLAQRKTYIRYSRDNTVEGLTVEQAEDILRDLHEYNDVSTSASRSKQTPLRKKRDLDFIAYLDTKQQSRTVS
jgi:hypothetical protein